MKIKAELVDAAEIKQRPRKAPATRMIEQLPKGHLTARQVAEKFDKNIETIRRLARQVDYDGNRKFKAPSKAMRSGDLVIWVYTPEYIKELAAHFGQRVSRPSGRGRKE